LTVVRQNRPTPYSGSAMPMAWRCPVCSRIIHHDDSDEPPRARARYRCHICRIELLFDVDAQRLIVRPAEYGDEERSRLPDRARRLLWANGRSAYRRPKAS
jgi:hypothetical protein